MLAYGTGVSFKKMLQWCTLCKCSGKILQHSMLAMNGRSRCCQICMMKGHLNPYSKSRVGHLKLLPQISYWYRPRYSNTIMISNIGVSVILISKALEQGRESAESLPASEGVTDHICIFMKASRHPSLAQMPRPYRYQLSVASVW